MANTVSARKRIRRSATQRTRNRTTLSALRTRIKSLRSVIAAGDSEAAKSQLGHTISVVDKTAQKGVIHRNAAARTKSRLTRAVAAIDA